MKKTGHDEPNTLELSEVAQLSEVTPSPGSGVAERIPSWRVPQGDRASTVGVVLPSWADTAQAAFRLGQELAGIADRTQAATVVARTLAALLPGRAVAVRLGVDGEPAIGSSRPLPRGESLERTLIAARAAWDRREPFGGPSGVFGESPDGFSIPIGAGTELVGAAAVEPLDEGATALHEVCAAALVLGQVGPTLALVRHGDVTVQRHLAWIVEQAPFPAALVDRSFVVRAVNSLASKALGSDPAELLGVPATKLAEASPRAQAALARIAGGEVVSGIELERRAKPSQRVVWVAVPLHDPSGAFAGALAFGDDRSAVHLLEEQILHAEKLATVGQLAAGIVHELNNPLTSISVYGDYLLQKAERQGGGDPADAERLRRIVEATARMLRFTRDLVSYARPSSEEPSELSLDEVIGQSIGFVEHVITGANVRVVVDLPADLPPVRAVRGQLHQVFVNLLTNATQAMASARKHAGAIRVTGGLESGSIRLRVADDGPGITAENVTRIFEPFFTTKEAGRGTGLGLSIVRNIVQLHGGTIDVESVHAESGAAQTGTTFVITLPARRDP